jgi:hypothetical protein
MEKQYYKFSALTGRPVVCTYQDAKETAERLRKIIKLVDDARSIKTTK